MKTLILATTLVVAASTAQAGGSAVNLGISKGLWGNTSTTTTTPEQRRMDRLEEEIKQERISREYAERVAEDRRDAVQYRPRQIDHLKDILK